MMLPFFWLILLVLPWVDTSVNSTSVGDNSTSRLENSTTGLDTAIQPRQGKRCMTIAVCMNSRELLVYKQYVGNCTFVIVQPPPTVIIRRLPSTNSFYYSLCCSGIYCNEGGPTNVERDLLPPVVFEEQVIARAVYLVESNLLLSLALIFSCSILSQETLHACIWVDKAAAINFVARSAKSFPEDIGPGSPECARTWVTKTGNLLFDRCELRDSIQIPINDLSGGSIWVNPKQRPMLPKDGGR
ncbi:LOW QUALITY PROTEIN: glycosyl-phosphatidylinositol-anchored molecule-like protein isoform X2 [Cricetulus griseus]|uniref:LOW QUALITY PROTEIN: glycosyl-phosphatidylinositol-anchored molecule-like protein isoform X2 n=1 Tax=Cricetulus griseus TaxID=10029 RepID=A0A9J7JIB9_CRIGR|nr:LOW QUALITY PROTEIN: glycosyl-phosphatidylinositol-anchored molecule-like protein isoform X2 [Cricetulus griseus]